MPSLNIKIPDNRKAGFVQLLDLKDDDFGRLLNALQESEVTSDNEKLISGIVAKILDKIENDVEELLAAIFPLYRLHAESELSINDFAEEVCDAVEEVLPAAESNRQQLMHRLVGLLSVEPISVSQKAASLRLQDERTFYDARIITDIRPVFRQDPHDPPVAYIFENTLKIEYFDEMSLKEFFVTLDTPAIQMLMDVLERARAKIETLKSVMKNADLPYIDSE